MNDSPAESREWESLRERLAVTLRTPGPGTQSAAARAELLQRRARQYRERALDPGPAGPTLTFLSFSAGGEQYGVPLDQLIEIQPLDFLSPLPRTPAFVRGVVQHHGQLLTLIDIGRVLGIPETGLADVHFYLVVEGSQRRVAVAAGELEEILTVPTDEIRPAPPLIADAPADSLIGLHAGRRLILQMNAILCDERLTAWRDATERR